jgi:hypothetical protein
MQNAKLNTILVRDPRVIVDNQREFAVLESGIRFRAKPWTTTSISSANIPFSTPAPSGDIYVDRKISLTLPVRLMLTGLVQPGYALINPNFDAPRAYPIHSMLDTITITINNASVTQNIGEIIHPLLRFNNSSIESEQDYSSTATALDLTQNYNSLVGSIANPLSMAGDADQRAQVGRGGFSNYLIVLNPVNTGSSAALMTAVIDMVFTEQIMMSPLFFGNGDASSFYNVTTMDWQFNFLNQAANRVWSHADNPYVALTPPLYTPPSPQIISASLAFNNFVNFAPLAGNFSFSLSQPYLNINYITPNPRLSRGANFPTIYPYFKVDKYSTDLQSGLAYGAPAQTVQTNNIQLSYVPRRCYLYLRASNSTYYSNPNITDTYYSINNVSIQFENYSGLLAESSQVQLWQMSRKNHCNIDWSNWSGQGFYPVGGSSYGTKYGGIGSILCFEFGTDIQLDPQWAPGTIGQFNLQVTVNYSNIDSTHYSDYFPVSIYLIVVGDGVFNIPALGVASTENAVLDQHLVLATLKESEFHNYNDIQQVNGGDFLSSLSKATSRLLKLPSGQRVKKVLKGTKAISNIARTFQDLSLPIVSPAAKTVHDVADFYGYGEGEGEGEAYGGRRISKKSLKSRARKVHF